MIADSDLSSAAAVALTLLGLLSGQRDEAAIGRCAYFVAKLVRGLRARPVWLRPVPNPCGRRLDRLLQRTCHNTRPRCHRIARLNGNEQARMLPEHSAATFHGPQWKNGRWHVSVCSVCRVARSRADHQLQPRDEPARCLVKPLEGLPDAPTKNRVFHTQGGLVVHSLRSPLLGTSAASDEATTRVCVRTWWRAWREG